MITSDSAASMIGIMEVKIWLPVPKVKECTRELVIRLEGQKQSNWAGTDSSLHHELASLSSILRALGPRLLSVHSAVTSEASP